MLKIGLTGGIGSGKSTVSRIFRHIKIPVYEADIEAKRLMATWPSLKSGIMDLLGEQAYINGNLNNKYIASIVFNNPEKLKELNKIVHPAVRTDFYNWASKRENHPYIVEEAAILFESGHYKDFDYTIFVSANEDLRIQRVMQRDSAKREDVLKRIKEQLPEEDKIDRSDFVINNNPDDLILIQVLELHNKFISLQD